MNYSLWTEDVPEKSSGCFWPVFNQFQPKYPAPMFAALCPELAVPTSVCPCPAPFGTAGSMGWPRPAHNEFVGQLFGLGKVQPLVRMESTQHPVAIPSIAITKYFLMFSNNCLCEIAKIFGPTKSRIQLPLVLDEHAQLGPASSFFWHSLVLLIAKQCIYLYDCPMPTVAVTFKK